MHGDRVTVAFVAGWGRSGSTLLDRLLGQVDGVASSGEVRETWQRGPVEDRRCGCGARFGACPYWQRVGREAFGGWDAIDADRLVGLRRRLDRAWMLPALYRGRLPGALAVDLAEYRRHLGRLYHGIAAASGAGVIVDSSKLASHALILRGVEGIDLRVVHLVRDSRGVTHSWSKRTERRDDDDGELMLRYGPVTAALRYDLYNEAAASLRRVGLPYQRVRYEDLVRDVPGTIRTILAHLGHDADLDFAAGGGAVHLGVDHLVDGNPMRFTTGELAIRSDEAWRDRLTPSARRTATSLTYPWLRRYGYAGSDSHAA